jgi:hypothetical protein
MVVNKTTKSSELEEGRVLMLCQKELSDLSQMIPETVHGYVSLAGDLQDLKKLKSSLETLGFYGFFRSDEISPVVLVITDKYEDSGSTRSETSPSGNNGGELCSSE